MKRVAYESHSHPNGTAFPRIGSNLSRPIMPPQLLFWSTLIPKSTFHAYPPSKYLLTFYSEPSDHSTLSINYDLISFILLYSFLHPFEVLISIQIYSSSFLFSNFCYVILVDREVIYVLSMASIALLGLIVRRVFGAVNGENL